MYVAVGADGAIVTSLDGAAWSTASSPTRADLISVAAGPSMFVAVGADGAIVTSPDGTSWSRRSSPTSADLVHVVFTGDKFVAVGGSWDAGAVTLTSHDGTTWTSVESPVDHMFHAVAHAPDRLLAAAYGRSDLQTPTLFGTGSSTGSSIAEGWQERQGPDFYDSVTIGDEIIVVGGSVVASTRDGVAWTEQQLPTTQLVSAIAAGSSTSVIVGELGTIYSSANGVDWLRQPSPGDARSFSGVTHGDAGFVAVGETGVVISSIDGAAWSIQRSPASAWLFDVAYGSPLQ